MKGGNNNFVMVCLYVNNMIIIGNNENIKASNKMLSRNFNMKDIGLFDAILGMRISKTSNGYSLSQCHYVEKILTRFDKNSDVIARTPMEVVFNLQKNCREGVRQLEYSRIIGILMFLMDCTRQDIANSVNRLARYTSNPSAKHWKAVVRVFRYLRYTTNYGLHYTRYPTVLEGYTNAN